jgi:hypothetical protein
MATKLKTQASIAAAPNANANANPNAKIQPQRRSNAQRQADYRARHLKDENSQLERLSLLVDFHAKCALERLACCYGVTQRAMLERLVMQADRVTQQQAQEQSSDGQADYFDKRISLQWPGVTQ